MLVGLTGSIASGKSTVSNYLKKIKNVFIIDADEISKSLQKKGKKAYLKILEVFSEDILLEDGEINREKLGKIVFNDKDKLKLLGELIHPLVKEEMSNLTNLIKSENKNPIVVWDVPLLIEAGSYKLVDKIIVVDIPVNIQIERLMQRNNLNFEESLKRINAQMSNEEKKKYASYIIDNSGTIEQTEKQIDIILTKLKKDNSN